MGEDEHDPPIILGRPFLCTVKAIIYIGTREVHLHFPSKKVRRYLLTLTITLKTLSLSENDASATRRGKSSRMDGQTMKEK